MLEAQGMPSLEKPLLISSFIETTHKDTSDFVQVLKKEKQILHGKKMQHHSSLNAFIL